MRDLFRTLLQQSGGEAGALLRALAEKLAGMTPVDRTYGTTGPVTGRKNVQRKDGAYKAAEDGREQRGEALDNERSSGSGAEESFFQGSDLPEAGQENAPPFFAGRDIFSFGRMKEKGERRYSADGGAEPWLAADGLWQVVEPETPVAAPLPATAGSLQVPFPAGFGGGRPLLGPPGSDLGGGSPALRLDGGAAGSADKEFDAEAMDRAFQRDARRYDGGFTLY